jgi:hypothetical protein
MQQLFGRSICDQAEEQQQGLSSNTGCRIVVGSRLLSVTECVVALASLLLTGHAAARQLGPHYQHGWPIWAPHP